MAKESNEELRIEYMRVGELTPYTRNARKHNDDDVEKIANSIREFGFLDPIGIWGEDNTVVEGHGRLLAAKSLGLEEVPTIRLDSLSDEQRRAYALAHNKTAENSSWDKIFLEIELDGILDIDMENFGFDLGGNEKEQRERPEVEFTEVLGEENNYIVLKFDDTVDWIQMQTLFELPTVANYSTRKDGKIKKQRLGVGRVVNGAKFIESLGLGK